MLRPRGNGAWHHVDCHALRPRRPSNRSTHTHTHVDRGPICQPQTIAPCIVASSPPRARSPNAAGGPQAPHHLLTTSDLCNRRVVIPARALRAQATHRSPKLVGHQKSPPMQGDGSFPSKRQTHMSVGRGGALLFCEGSGVRGKQVGAWRLGRLFGAAYMLELFCVPERHVSAKLPLLRRTSYHLCGCGWWAWGSWLVFVACVPMGLPCSWTWHALNRLGLVVWPLVRVCVCVCFSCVCFVCLECGGGDPCVGRLVPQTSLACPFEGRPARRMVFPLWRLGPCPSYD